MFTLNHLASFMVIWKWVKKNLKIVAWPPGWSSIGSTDKGSKSRVSKKYFPGHKIFFFQKIFFYWYLVSTAKYFFFFSAILRGEIFWWETKNLGNLFLAIYKEPPAIIHLFDRAQKSKKKKSKIMIFSHKNQKKKKNP